VRPAGELGTPTDVTPIIAGLVADGGEFNTGTGRARHRPAHCIPLLIRKLI